MIDLAKEKLTQLGGVILWKLISVFLILFAAHIVIKIIDKLLDKVFDWTEIDRTLEKFIHKTIITILWLMTLGILLISLGVDINAVVASFGVMSFIVGFALKDSLGNLASGFMILLNKPFIVGDDIEIKGVKGRVKTVSMSNTKLVTEDKNKVTLPNSFVWNNPIINYTAYKNLKTK